MMDQSWTAFVAHPLKHKVPLRSQCCVSAYTTPNYRFLGGVPGDASIFVFLYIFDATFNLIHILLYNLQLLEIFI